MAAAGSQLGLLWRTAMKTAAPRPRGLHVSPWWADSSRASLARLRRQAYARLYPVLLVKQDGSTIHIRYREPRRMLLASSLLWLRSAVEDGPGAWALHPHGRPGEAPGSWLRISEMRQPQRPLEGEPTMPLDLDTLSPEQRRARLHKRGAQLRPKEEDPELADDFDVERYRRFWTQK